jgi:hypothetical protein
LSFRRIVGPTPNGGAYMDVYVDDESTGQVAIVEYDEGGEMIFETFGWVDSDSDDDSDQSGVEV